MSSLAHNEIYSPLETSVSYFICQEETVYDSTNIFIIMLISFFPQNYVRVVEVWWDEYKDYFYASRPESKALAYGDISELKKFREDHNCKSFKWFMEEIAYDITSHYPLPPKNVDWGEVSVSWVIRYVFGD